MPKARAPETEQPVWPRGAVAPCANAREFAHYILGAVALRVERKIKPNTTTTTKPRSPEIARSEAPGDDPPSPSRLSAAVRSALNGRPLPLVGGRATVCR